MLQLSYQFLIAAFLSFYFSCTTIFHVITSTFVLNSSTCYEHQSSRAGLLPQAEQGASALSCSTPAPFGNFGPVWKGRPSFKKAHVFYLIAKIKQQFLENIISECSIICSLTFCEYRQTGLAFTWSLCDGSTSLMQHNRRWWARTGGHSPQFWVILGIIP